MPPDIVVVHRRRKSGGTKDPGEPVESQSLKTGAVDDKFPHDDSGYLTTPAANVPESL